MKVKITKPDTIKFIIKFEKDDEFYSRCSHVTITFDNENWFMNAHSDIGNYCYGWWPEEKRKFLELMQELDNSYLLGKISQQSEFDLKASKKNLIKWLECEDEENQLEEQIKNINAYDSNDFVEKVKKIEDFKESDFYIWECIVRDYPDSAKTFAKIFINFIQPEIRKYLKEQEEEESK